MKSADMLDYSRLLGFAALGETVTGAIDFREATVDARLGAKVGTEVTAPRDADKPAD